MLPLEVTYDVVVVGAGYTGLSAALTLARSGRSVLVIDKQRPGEGASTRNGGITSGNLRPNFASLIQRFGIDRATAITAEAKIAREDLYRFIAREKVDCDFALVGRFSGAVTAADYERLGREADHLRSMGIDAYSVCRSDQRNYLGTDAFHGGAVRMDIGGLHPAKLHAEMMRLVREAGATVQGETALLDLSRVGDLYEIKTSRGTTRANDVVMATNGYADQADRWLRRRLVPVRSRIIATEPLSKNLIGELMPRQMVCNNTKKVGNYFRTSPDGRRILFGGRDATLMGSPSGPTEELRRQLVELFPVLDKVAIDYSWYGNVAMNRDMIPRLFTRRGIRYAAGYCGSGVVWARWAGQKAALQILGDADGASSLDFRPPAAVPLFRGTPWFLPAVFAWLSLQQRLASRRR